MEKGSAGKDLGVIFPRYSKTMFLMENLTQRWTQLGHSLQNQGTFF